MSIADTATEFREAGLRVFPLYGADASGNCECGNADCPALFKHPISSNWQNTPVWGEEQWETICEYQLTTGYGVLCAGLLVLDVDIRNGGGDSLAKLLEDVPEVAGAGLVVNTGSGDGSRHYYFKAPAGVPLVSKLDAYPGLDFKSSGYVVGPGSLHRSGKRYEISLGSPDDLDDAPAPLIDMLRRPDRHRAEWDGRALDVAHGDLADMLAHINPDCDYETWIRCGMAVHDASDGSAFEVWDDWSGRGTKYDGETIGKHWHSFGKSGNPVRIGTLIHYAEQGGWLMPVSLVAEPAFDLPEQDADEPRADGLPCDISGVDLTAPPGLVGQCAEWLEATSRRPRRHLAVAGALTAVGNIAGLRYTDDKDGVTTNLFTFCVAGSRTGKEAIQQGVTTLHRAAGIAPATHGAIKSEQEITRNLIRHQMAAYSIDEIGLFLGKVKNAQKSGGALYLDGVIGMLMQAYSKADGYMLLTGDAKDDLKAALGKELAQVKKQIWENDFGPENSENDTEDVKAQKQIERDRARSLSAARQAQIEAALRKIDDGLEKPFLSLIGFTTPVTFEDLVDYQSATNGFIGRSLIFNERNTAPRSKRRWRKPDLPEGIGSALLSLYTGGEYDMTAPSRVEYYGPRTAIPTTRDAVDLLERITDWMEDQAVAHTSRSGLEALYLGAYELVSKVSLILACGERLRTVEHVRWAFALVKRDVDEKAMLVTANDREKDAPETALSARIMGLISGEDGATEGVVYNRLRKWKREDVKKALDRLVEKGLASVAETQNKRGSNTLIYRKV